jgi:hypothetical protein
MSALGDVRASDMKHIWAAAGANNAAGPVNASQQLTPLNLASIDVDMEDMTEDIGNLAATGDSVASPDDGHGPVPPLHSFQSPLASPMAGGSNSQSQREQVCFLVS